MATLERIGHFGRGAVFGLGALALCGAATAQTVVEPTIADVDWGAAERDAGEEGASARPQESDTLAAAADAGESPNLRLPLLLPTSLTEQARAGEIDDGPRLFTDENFYTAVATDEGRTYMIQGTIVVFAVDDAPVDEEAGPISVQRTETGVEATFDRYNVAYSITIECEDLFRDPVCADFETVLRLAEEMAFAD